ncbi:MAG: SIS domain-containing protein [Methanomicrobiaceae archaeon]|nr:SIS domain-containing protein [Methanomicrobiaceae archaeon]
MMRSMAESLAQVTDTIARDDVTAFLAAILDARRIFVLGMGRSGLVACVFAMRLTHLGIPTYVVGETIVPQVTTGSMAGDLLILFSSTGRDGVATRFAVKAAHTGGAAICVVTGNRDSPAGQIAHYIIEIPCDPFLRPDAREERTCFSPLGTFFETAAWVFADAVISGLMAAKGVSVETMGTTHANLLGLFLIPDD